MPRLEVELTSARPDGSWTWRKAGARQPKGEVAGSLLPGEAKVGDVLKVEAEVLIDGIEITEVLPTKGKKEGRYERIELNPAPEPKELVSTQLAPKGRGGRDRDRGPRRDRDGDRGPRREGDRGRGREGERGRGPRTGDRPSGGREGARRHTPMPDLPERPKPKRIRPGRTHRNAVLNDLAPEQRPVAEAALQGGIPAVRAAIDTQNTSNRAQGLPEVKGDELVDLAEKLLPSLKLAEWRDRAEAAVAVIEEVDLRDLRSVVVASDSVPRDDEVTRLRDELSAAYTRRSDEEHAAWLEELKLLLDADRVVRALRVSSRPPKAGVPLPKELGERLTTATAASLTAETSTERWDTVLDALCFSPVRTAVKATSRPETPSEELIKIVSGVAERLPQIAEQFGIDPATVPKRARKRPGAERRPKKPGAGGAGGGAGGGGAPASKKGPKTPATPKAEPAEKPAAAEPETAEPETAPDTTATDAPPAPPEAAPEPEAAAEPTPEPEAAAEPTPEPEAAAESDQVEDVERVAEDDA